MKFLLILSHFFAFSALADILVPPPPGPYDVAVKVLPMTDETRPWDPFVLPPRSGGSSSSGGGSSSPSPKGRQLLLSVFLPVDIPHAESPCPRLTIPYMTPRVAADYGAQAAQAGLPADLYAQFRMQVCDPASLSLPLPLPPRCRHRCVRPGRKYPVVLFTPGLQESRLLYGAGARSLASRGYVVITVDHVLEASFVEFPDGTVVPGRSNLSGSVAGDDDDDNDNAAAAAAAMRELLVQVRTADLSFVINQLHNDSLTDLLLGPWLSRTLDLRKMLVYGHSLGGAAAADLARTDGRVRGAINLDGQMVDPARRLGLDKPFLLAGRYNHSGEDGTWDEVWPHLRGPRAEMAIRGTAHASFTDRPLLVSALGLPERALRGLESLIGSIEGRRLEGMVNEVLVGFLEYTLYNKDEGIRSLTKKYAGQVLIPRSDL
ncbi:hypothetical protein E4U55_000014 [Claviceps digitariae]|nr:hypothetical protein E4U55_000014 [Claviceps digitariae]